MQGAREGNIQEQVHGSSKDLINTHVDVTHPAKVVQVHFVCCSTYYVHSRLLGTCWVHRSVPAAFTQNSAQSILCHSFSELTKVFGNKNKRLFHCNSV